MVIFQNKSFFFFPLKWSYFLKGGVGQYALALAECPRGQPWLLLLAYEGCFGLGCVP